MAEDNGGGAPAMDVIRAATVNVRYHLAYIGWLARRGIFSAGDRSVTRTWSPRRICPAIDYLGDVPWNEDDAAKAWYARIKSARHSAAAGRMAGRRAGVADHVDLDF